MEKSADAFRTISEVAADLALPQHVLRFWETRFPQVRPLKRAGGRRYYRPHDIGLLRSIRHLLYDEGYTIKGVQRLLKEQGARSLPSRDVAGLEATDPTDAPSGFETGLPDAGVIEPDAPIRPDPELVDPSPSAVPTSRQEHRDGLHDALGCVEECVRILRAVLPNH